MEIPAAEPIACVLAGGQARRLGGAKATLDLAGWPLISYPLRAARWAGLEAVVVAKPGSRLPEVDVPLWLEEEESHHPAAGIAMALRRASGRPVLAIACDMPLLPPGLLLRLAQTAGPLAVPADGGRLHPLCARYELPLLEPLERALADGTALQETVESAGPQLIAGPDLALYGDPEVTLFNVNTPADLARAEELLRELN